VAADNELDRLSIAAVQRLLPEIGVDMATVVDVPIDRPRPADERRPGVA
jgi:hypothetical protein